MTVLEFLEEQLQSKYNLCKDQYIGILSFLGIDLDTPIGEIDLEEISIAMEKISLSIKNTNDSLEKLKTATDTSMVIPMIKKYQEEQHAMETLLRDVLSSLQTNRRTRKCFQ